MRQGASWKQLEENIAFVQQHWSHTTSLNMVYSMFNAFNLPEIVNTFRSFGIQKFNLMPIDSNRAMNVFCMPEPIRQLAKVALEKTNTEHQRLLHPEDQKLYPIQGIKQMLDQFNKQNTNIVIKRSDFEQQIAWYDQWSTSCFRELWPDVINLTNLYLPS